MAATIASTYSDEDREKFIEHVLAETATGRFISRILVEDENMPAASTWWRWVFADETLEEKVARARSQGIEALLDECGEIADDGTNDYVERKRDDGSTETVLDREHVQRSKLRIDTRIKLAQMLKPKTYGPKLDLTSGGEKLGLADRMLAAERRLKEGDAE